jgi:hypothetical protein
MVSPANPVLFVKRVPQATAALDQYAGTDTELDPKQAPMLFRDKRDALRATATPYAGTETEIDVKNAPGLFGQRRAADLATAAHYAHSDAEMDPKPPAVLCGQKRGSDRASAGHYAGTDTEIDTRGTPGLFGQRRAADLATAAHYVRSDAEMDVKISDRRLKREIRQIGVSPSGLAIYSFRYVWGGPIFVGVMAQDLVAMRPEAVIEDESGYLMVDYDKIDVKMTSLDSHDEVQASAPALFARRRAADRVFGAHYIGSESEADFKSPAAAIAAQYAGTHTEIDVKRQ